MRQWEFESTNPLECFCLFYSFSPLFLFHLHFLFLLLLLLILFLLPVYFTLSSTCRLRLVTCLNGNKVQTCTCCDKTYMSIDVQVANWAVLLCTRTVAWFFFLLFFPLHLSSLFTSRREVFSLSFSKDTKSMRLWVFCKSFPVHLWLDSTNGDWWLEVLLKLLLSVVLVCVM